MLEHEVQSHSGIYQFTPGPAEQFLEERCPRPAMFRHLRPEGSDAEPLGRSTQEKPQSCNACATWHSTCGFPKSNMSEQQLTVTTIL